MCKFPPIIAEFREQMESVNGSIRELTSLDWSRIRLDLDMGMTPRQIFEALPPDSLSRMAMTSMGGPEKIIQECGLLNYYGFEEAFQNAIRSQDSLPGGDQQRMYGGEHARQRPFRTETDNRIRRNNHGKRYVCSS